MHLVLSLLLAACGGSDTPDAPEKPAAAKAAKAAKAKAKKPATPPTKDPRPPAEALVGTLSYASDPPSVTPCDGGAPVPLAKGGGDPAAVRKELGETVDDVYVEVKGYPQEDGAFRVRTFETAIVEGHGCGAELPAFRAFGNEPFWSLSVEGDTWTLSRPDAADLAVPAGTKKEVKGANVYEATEGDTPMILSVRRRRCADTMASAFYAYQVSLTVGDETFEGCGRGDLP